MRLGISDSLRNVGKNFARDTRGAVALIFALTLFVLIGCVGGAVDFARWHQAKTQMQNAMDAAVLAGGRAMQTTNDETVAVNAANQYYANMKYDDMARGSAVFAMQEAGTVLRGVLDGATSAPFLGVIGIPELPVRVRAEAVLASGGNSGTNVEVSLMLDITGSMAGQKIVDMKTAAKDLVDIVVWDDQSSYTSKVAIVPFAPRVNVGSYISSVTGLPASKTFSGHTRHPIVCVTERTGIDEFTDAAPISDGDRISAYRGNTDTTAVNDSNNYSGSGSCTEPSSSEQVIPLASDKTMLKGRIDGLSAGGSTAGALGTAWAWYLISPNWSSIWPSSSRPAPYSDLARLGSDGQPVLKKYAVLMTDGIYNTYAGANQGDTSTMAVTISSKALQLCRNMKAAGIKVFTVGFDLGGSQLAINTLRDCASREAGDPADQPSYFYNASTGEELRQAFRDIALQIATLRLRS